MSAFGKKRNLDEINLARKFAGLPPLKCKNKRCTKCSRTFLTTAYDICCGKCRRANQEIFDYLGEYGAKNNYV